MREIKFRGISKGENNWIYGSLLTNREGTYPRICVQTIERDLVTENILKFVHPNTVGQFTGLKDVNGKEIYEGDIIYSEFPDGSKTNCLIGWDEENSCFGLMDEYNYRSKLEGYDFPKFENAIFCNFRKISKKFEVIGNIYDNPELLKGGAHENT